MINISILSEIFKKLIQFTKVLIIHSAKLANFLNQTNNHDEIFDFDHWFRPSLRFVAFLSQVLQFVFIHWLWWTRHHSSTHFLEQNSYGGELFLHKRISTEFLRWVREIVFWHNDAWLSFSWSEMVSPTTSLHLCEEWSYELLPIIPWSVRQNRGELIATSAMTIPKNWTLWLTLILRMVWVNWLIQRQLNNNAREWNISLNEAGSKKQEVWWKEHLKSEVSERRVVLIERFKGRVKMIWLFNFHCDSM
jgi:hypothetical protein